MSRLIDWLARFKLFVGSQRQYLEAKSEKIERYPGDMASDLEGTGYGDRQRGRRDRVSNGNAAHARLVECEARQYAGKVFEELILIDRDMILRFQDGSRLWIRSGHHFKLVGPLKE